MGQGGVGTASKSLGVMAGKIMRLQKLMINSFCYDNTQNNLTFTGKNGRWKS
jgi:hypothetical protein